MADAAHSPTASDDVLSIKLEQQKQAYEARYSRLKVQLSEKDIEIQRLQGLLADRVQTKEGMQSHVDSLTVTTEILTRQLGFLTGLLRVLDPTKALEKVVDRYMSRVRDAVEKGDTIQRAEDFLVDLGKANEKLLEAKKGHNPVVPPAELLLATKFVPVFPGQSQTAFRALSPTDAAPSGKVSASNQAELRAERRKSKVGLKFQARKSIVAPSVLPFAPPLQGQSPFAALSSNPSLPTLHAQSARDRQSTALVSPPTSRRQSLAAGAALSANQSSRNLGIPQAQGGLCKGRSMRRDQFSIWLNQHGVSSGGEEDPQGLDSSHNGTTVFPEVSMRSVHESQESDEVDSPKLREGSPAKGAAAKPPPSFRTLAKKRGTVFRNLNMDGLIDANVFTEVKAAKAKANQLRAAFTRELEEKEAEVGALKTELSVVKEELKVTKESENKLKLQCERLITERLTRSPQSVGRRQQDANPAPLATFAFVPSDLEGSGRRDPPSILGSSVERHSPSSSTRSKGTADGELVVGPRPLSPSRHEQHLELPPAVDALNPNPPAHPQVRPSKMKEAPSIIPSIPLLPAIGGTAQRKQSPSSTPRTRPQRATVQASQNTTQLTNDAKYSPINVQYGKTAVGFRLLLSCYVQDVCNLLRSCQPVQDKLFQESVKMQDFMLDRWYGKNIHVDEPPGNTNAGSGGPTAGPGQGEGVHLNHLLNLNLEEVIPSFVHNVMADQLLKEAPDVDKWEDERELLKQTWISLTRSLQQFVAHFQQQMGQWRKAQVADFAAHKVGHVVPKPKRPPAPPSVAVQTTDGSLKAKETSPKKAAQKHHSLRSPKQPSAKHVHPPSTQDPEIAGANPDEPQPMEDEDGKAEADTTGL
jgi:hypothetical protein